MTNALDVVRWLASLINQGDVILEDKKVQLAELLSLLPVLIGLQPLVTKFPLALKEWEEGTPTGKAEVIKAFGDALTLKSDNTEAQVENGFAFVAYGLAFFKGFVKEKPADSPQV